jgi:hypothetical protein
VSAAWAMEVVPSAQAAAARAVRERREIIMGRLRQTGLKGAKQLRQGAVTP